jgi:hypothetical protein
MVKALCTTSRKVWLALHWFSRHPELIILGYLQYWI